MQRLPRRALTRRAGPAAIGLLLAVGWSSPSWPQQSEADSPHGKLNLNLDCSACHTPDGWSPAKAEMEFDHDEDTSFALLGNHREATCGGCHLGLRFDEPRVENNDCGSCHVDVHLGNFSDNCSGCHNAISFGDVARLAIHAKTSFPLSGSHMQVSCDLCHSDDRGGAYGPLDSHCVSCHEADYQSAVSIDHVALGFSSSCEDCHNAVGWGVSHFDHIAVSNGFDLLGAHAFIRCEECHVMPGLDTRYQPSSQNDCLACHEADHQRHHTVSGFPTDCYQCHNQNDWGGATISIEHDPIFPIFSGTHEGTWRNQCTVCHTVPNSRQVFSCLNCHDHYQAPMDEKHQNVDGYVYVSTLCYDCHPTGERGS